MEIGHMHFGFKDFEGSVTWMKSMLDKEPGYRNQNMASFDFENSSLVFDQSENDAVATLALRSADCDRDFLKMKARGAEVLESPTDQPWGVRTAYFQGPGAIIIEIEQPLN